MELTVFGNKRVKHLSLAFKRLVFGVSTLPEELCSVFIIGAYLNNVASGQRSRVRPAGLFSPLRPALCKTLPTTDNDQLFPCGLD